MSWKASTQVRTWHRWLSIVVGLQLLLWTLSGLVMTWVPIAEVRGEHLVAELDSAEWPGEHAPPALTPPALLPTGTTQLRLARLRARWVWHALDSGSATLALWDATDGSAMTPMTEEQASVQAQRLFAGDGQVSSTQWTTEAPLEYRGQPVPVWRVQFDDEEQSALYLDPLTGELRKLRTDTWRRFDFFWMLHIMDYEQRTDFNHPLLQVAAGFGVTTALTGLWLAVLVLRSRRRQAAGI